MPSSPSPDPTTTSKINAYQALAHLPRTLKVAGKTLQDSRVSVLPKMLFIGSVVFVLAALLTPEALAEFVAVVPGMGDILAIGFLPVDGAIDWMALGIVALNLMKLFPQEIVNEHFDNATAKSKPSGRVVDADPVH
ncbi:MAG TPA: hypothetical protein VE338_05075 [Ktedonobacterales bacterium]|jgi:hypothetical protein|nr:hypothetical protein [Ktedonobacterales bacterium]